MNSQEFKVKGMTCPNCVRHVKQAFEKVEGVHDVTVHLESGKVAIQYDENVLDTNKLQSALDDTAYEMV